MADLPKPGDTWKVKTWERTRWANATVTLERPYWEGPGEPVGWLFKRNPHQLSSDARYNNHIKFLRRLQHGTTIRVLHRE